MKTTLTLTPCEDVHLSEITRIYSHAVQHGTASFETEPPTEDEMRRRRHALRDAGYPYLVALFDGRVAGYAYVSAYRARAAYGATVENSVYVDPALQGQGVARALLDDLEQVCSQGPWRQMVAVIGDSANRASIRLHEVAGFALVGTLRSVGFKHGRWLDTVLMQRPLGQGDRTPRA